MILNKGIKVWLTLKKSLTEEMVKRFSGYFSKKQKILEIRKRINIFKEMI